MKPPKIGERVFCIEVNDAQILEAFNRWKIDTPHEDAPEMPEASRLRQMLADIVGPGCLILCPMWLRNRAVEIRKAGLCKPKPPPEGR